jgi:septal ring factor EnvC (AmiA/AmiB activator)
MDLDSISIHHQTIINFPVAKQIPAGAVRGVSAAADTRAPGRMSGVAAAWLLLGLLAAMPGADAAGGAGDGAAPAASMQGQPLEVQEAELRAAEARLAGLRETLTDREAYRDALYAELERNDRDIAALARTVRDLATRHADQKALVADLDERLAGARAELAAVREQLRALLRAAYAVGPGDRLRLLLNQQDPARAGRQLGYFRAVGRLRAARMADVERLGRALADLRREAEREADRLAALAAQERRTQTALQAASQARRAVLADLETAIADDRAEVAELDANAAALRAVVAKLRARAKIADEIAITEEAIHHRRGQLPPPITDARLVRPFAGKASPGDLHADGVLFAAPVGSEVFPVHHGQVVYADWLRGFGLLVVVDHGDGYMTLYGHNQALLKEVGEWVDPGDVLALSGTVSSTDIDRSDAAVAAGRLYFALRREGAPVDPAPWLASDSG